MLTPRIFDDTVTVITREVTVRPSRSRLHWDPFIGLVNDVQVHLVRSKSTRAAYLKLLANFYDSSVEARALRLQPTDEEILQYFQDSFPHIHVTGISMHPSASDVDLKVPGLNEIFPPGAPIVTMLLSEDREREPQSTTFQMSRDEYTLIAAVMLLDALRYPLIQHFFAPILPAKYGIHLDTMAAQEGWPNWDIEHALFGFHVTGECKPGAQDAIRDMTSLLAEMPGKSFALDDPQELRHFLDSFKTETLHRMSIANAAEVSTDPPPGALRERIESAFYLGSALKGAVYSNKRKALEGVEMVRSAIGGNCRWAAARWKA